MPRASDLHAHLPRPQAAPVEHHGNVPLGQAWAWSGVRGIEDEDHHDRIETRDQVVVRVVWAAQHRPFPQNRQSARTAQLRRCGAPGRIRTADAGLRTAALYPLSYGGATSILAPAGWRTLANAPL